VVGRRRMDRLLRFDSGAWQLWRMPAGDPGKAARISEQRMMSLVGWAKGRRIGGMFRREEPVLDGAGRQGAANARAENCLWQSTAMDEQRPLRLDPRTRPAGRLAFYEETPKGAPVDEMDLNSTIALADLKSGKRPSSCQ